MVKYRAVCGNKSIEANYSSSETVEMNLYYITNRTISVYAIDSRGNSTRVDRVVTDWKEYTDPKLNSISISRQNGVGTDTILAFSGTFWNNNFGSVTNTITECSYKYKKTSESSYGSSIDITPTINGSSISFNSTVVGDEGANGFTIANSYNIQLTIKDSTTRSIIYNLLLSAGNPSLAIHKDGIAVGTPYNTSLSGLIQFAADKYLSSGGALSMNNSDIVDINGIFMNDESDSNGEGINFLKQGAQQKSRDRNDYECLRGYRGTLYYDDKAMLYLEKGSNTNGNYIKFSDGTMICYKEISLNVACTNSWGVLYENGTALDFGDWAATFYSTPFVMVEKTASRGSWLQTMSDTSTTKVGKGYVASATSFTSSVTFACLGIGRWK